MTSTEYVAGLFDLTGHVGIITGGSRGLGFGQVKVLTDAGATVYNLDLIPHSDEQMIREGHLIDIRCDVTDYDAVEKTVGFPCGWRSNSSWFLTKIEHWNQKW